MYCPLLNISSKVFALFFKKVSDFLIDSKVSLLEKETVNVLEKDGNIIWVVGYRINDQYKITKQTKQALILSI